MRSLNRNRRKFYYKTVVGVEEKTDEWGNYTGEYAPVYSELKSAYANISANKGDVSSQQFGNLLDYDRTISTTNLNIGLDETGVLWLDGADTDKAHNFIVKKVAKSINSVQIAIKQVEVVYGH